MNSNYPPPALTGSRSGSRVPQLLAWEKDYAAIAAAAVAATAHAPAGTLNCICRSPAAPVREPLRRPRQQRRQCRCPHRGRGVPGRGRRGPRRARPHRRARSGHQPAGGTIDQADLNEYARAKGQAARVRLENHDSPETLYLLQAA